MSKTFSVQKFNKVVSKATENMDTSSKMFVRYRMLYLALKHANKIGAK